MARASEGVRTFLPGLHSPDQLPPLQTVFHNLSLCRLIEQPTVPLMSIHFPYPNPLGPGMVPNSENLRVIKVITVHQPNTNILGEIPGGTLWEDIWLSLPENLGKPH